MDKRVTFRLSDKLLDLLNKDAIIAEVEFSLDRATGEQIRIVLEMNYGLLNQVSDKLSDKKITVKEEKKPMSDNKWDIESMIQRQKSKEKPKVIGHLGSKRVE